MDDIILPAIIKRYHFEAQASRMLGDVLFPFHLKACATFEYDAETEDDEDEIVFAITKIQYWVEHILDNSVMFSAGNTKARKMFLGDETQPENILYITPDDPTDDVVLATLVEKFQAIAGKYLRFISIEMINPNRMGISTILECGDESFLPDGDHWFGSIEKKFFDKPWWERDDGSSFDAMPAEGQDPSIRPPWAFEFDFLKEQNHPSPRPSPSGPNGKASGGFTIIDGGKK